MAAAGSGRGEVSGDDTATDDEVVEETPTEASAEPDAAEPDAAEPDAAEPDAEPDADEPATDETHTAETSERATPAAWPHRRRVRRLLLAAVVLGVLLGAAGLLAPRLQARADDGESRAAATAAAAQFVVDINTYDSAKVGEYQGRMDPLLTPAYRKEFDALTTQAFTVLATQKVVSREARVTGTAVDTLDDDSATVLVAANAQVSSAQQATPAERPLRWRVELSRRDGDWLVARYEAVASQGADGAPAVPQQGATPAPTASPTAVPTPAVPTTPGTTP